MFIASFPARFLPEVDGKGYHVRFRDLPEALTGGDDLEDAAAQAVDCLAEAIAGRISRRQEVPTPSGPKRGERLVSVPLGLAPKLALYLTVRERGLPHGEVAKLLGTSETEILRMLDPKSATDPEKIQQALGLLGKRIVVSLEDAA